MPKKLRGYKIYIAPQISGYLDTNGQPVVYDEKTKKSLDPNNINDKITIYERQVKEWFLNRASRLLSGKKNGFIILMLSISYIEGVERYRQGNNSRNSSTNYFKTGLQRIFAALHVSNHDLNDFYSQVRCGLFHVGMTRKQVIISQLYPHPIDFSESNTIKINPKKFLRDIKLDFNRYLKELRDPTKIDLRNNFDSMYRNM
ncbi:MAG: hypothetical protein ABIJ15_00720 [bacterium]